MTRRMSFSMTRRQFLDGSKTVTRRLGSEFLKAGDELIAIEKGMGLKAGEAQVIIGRIRVKSVRREPLELLLQDSEYGVAEVRAEGFPGLTPEEFIAFYRKSHAGCHAGRAVTRIEFERIDQ